MKERAKLNLAVDALMLLALALVAGLGFAMEYVLPPGRSNGGGMSHLLFGLDRHQWGTVHLWAAFILIGLLAVHLILHWSLVKALLRGSLPDVSKRRRVVAVFCGLVVLLMFLPVCLNPDDRGDHRRGRYSNDSSGGRPEESLSGSSLTGKTTLAETSQCLGITVAEIRERLGLPADVPETETLGHIRQSRNLSMGEVRTLLHGGGPAECKIE